MILIEDDATVPLLGKNMNLLLKALGMVLLVVPLLGADVAKRYPIIPKPVSLVASDGTFTITPATRILVNSPETRELALFIADFLSVPLNAALPVGGKQGDRDFNPVPSQGAITIIVDKALALEAEGYTLSITPDALTIQAKTTEGAFWAFMTLRQLMPAEAQRPMPLAGASISIPCALIKDVPRFAYRGLHLDVARHFFPVDFIKKYLDLMAFYKLNTFHWHLTDDQGWRIEIKKYPKLHEVAAYRKQTLKGHLDITPWQFDGQSYGGYYTQEQIKDIVAYARQRHITIIPEIELPGHCIAALAAYPQLSCSGGPYETKTAWGYWSDIYCAGNEETFIFLQDVLTEVLELFPSKYIHIGGDEALKKQWQKCSKCQKRIKDEHLKDEHELQSYVIARIEKFLNDKGRTIIGWDEILDGGLAPNATVMSWRGTQGGIKAAQLQHPVIMTPCDRLYFCAYQSHASTEPLANGWYLPLEKVYSYEPVPAELDEKQACCILGAQACMWTEYIAIPEHVEYMLFPRLTALAEVVWTPAHQKNYDDFILRLQKHERYLRAMSVHYADV